MGNIARNDPLWIQEGALGETETDSVLPLVFRILVEIPFEVDCHGEVTTDMAE